MLITDLGAGPTNTLEKLTDAQLLRIEACRFFFPDPPRNIKRGRRTVFPITTIKSRVMELTKRCQVLRSADPERLTLKIELANETLDLRFKK
jgi:hypothetical protein